MGAVVMIPQEILKQLIKFELNTSRNMALLELMYDTVIESDSEYYEKEAFRVHALDDHTMICKDCHGGVVVPLHRDSNFLGVCLQTQKFVCGYERYQNEWSQWYMVYEHITSIGMLRTAIVKHSVI